eukprot:6112403-Amphidinium_carterae.2
MPTFGWWKADLGGSWVEIQIKGSRCRCRLGGRDPDVDQWALDLHLDAETMRVREAFALEPASVTSCNIIHGGFSRT